jgi:hypothetical protein
MVQPPSSGSGGGPGWGRRIYLVILFGIVQALHKLGLRSRAQQLAKLAAWAMDPDGSRPRCEQEFPPGKLESGMQPQTGERMWRCDHLQPHCFSTTYFTKIDCGL